MLEHQPAPGQAPPERKPLAVARNLTDPFALRQIRQLASVVPHCRGRVVFFALCMFWITSPALLAHSFTGQVERVIDGDTVVVLVHDSEVGGPAVALRASSVALRAMEDKMEGRRRH